MFTLRPMTQSEYDRRIPLLKAEYAQDEVKAGRGSAEEIAAHVDQQFADLLPQGLATEGQLLLAGEADGEVIGYIWLALPTQARPQAWIYEIQVDEAHRRRGHGRSLMLAAEDELRSRGVTSLGLNVFAHNSGARRLYETLGFEVTSQRMSKPLK